MRLALIGYGKMGHEVEGAAKARGHSISAIIDPSAEGATSAEISGKAIAGADVCIDFTVPDAVIENARAISLLKKNIVVGTTGWHNNSDELEKIVRNSKIGLIYASNFSIGVNAFCRMVDAASRIMDKLPQYDVYGLELHHSRKKDSPSGTAKSIGDILLRNMKRKKRLLYEKIDRKIEPDELHFASVRAGDIPGTHIVGFESSADSIELKHIARGREGFAYGAVIAAEWIAGKKGFYSIDDLMNDLEK